MDNSNNTNNATSTPEEQKRATWQDIADLKKMAERLGVYVLTPTPDLTNAARRYFDDNVANIAKRLVENGAKETTVEAVINDYGRAVVGVTPWAKEAQMKDALKALSPVQAFSIDRYVLYFAVFSSYAAIIGFFGEYVQNVKLQPAPSQRQAWFETIQDKTRALDAVAFTWMQHNGYIVVSDFAGVEQSAIRNFLNTMERKADVGKYLRYYAVAKFALRATPEQLAAIPTPPTFGAPNMATQYAEDTMAEIQRDFDDKAAKLVKIAEQTATGETPDAETVREAKAAVTAIECVRVPENYALINSREMWAARDGTANEILPISAVIDDYVKRHAEETGVTPLILHKVVEGVNLLIQIKKVRPVGGIFTIKTNMSEFSILCGYTDANEEQKQQLLTALKVLHNLYLIVWKSKGPTAVQIFGLQQYGLNKDGRRDLVLNVFTSGIGNGRPNLISSAELSEMIRNEKGAAMMHFRYQILSKGHKVESALLDEIFGYSDKIRAAELTGDAEQVAAVREYIRKHKSRDKKRLLQWFVDWAKRGILSVVIKVADPDKQTLVDLLKKLGGVDVIKIEAKKDGEPIYNWRRLMAPTPEEKQKFDPNGESGNGEA